MAAPHVTGTAALAMGRFPIATSAQIKQLILASTDPIASMSGTTSTGGRLNAYKVLLNGDGTPPSRVTNLAVADTGSTSIGLAWTAPGDDGAVGTAASYDLRMSASPIDSINFAAAAPVAVASPHAGGTAEVAQVSGLAFGTPYHFALRAIDDFGYKGPVSNDVSVTTLGIPALALSPASLMLVVVPGTVTDTALVVSNIGQGRLDFCVTNPSAAPWLTATPDSGSVPAGASTRVGLHVDATALAYGAYDTTLPITSNDPNTPTASMHLVVNVLTGVAEAYPAVFRFQIRSRSPGPHSMTFALSLPASGPVDVSIFDVHGRRITRLAHGTLPAGVHPFHWDGADETGERVGSGVYFARARTGREESTERIVILE
jgi:hypothetical protein